MPPKVSDEYKKKKKNELLQAARDVFIRKGYAHATMQDIIDEAGVSRGALYSYFSNIEHAFREVLQAEDQEDINYFEQDDQTSFWEQLTNWIEVQQKNIEAINKSLLLCKAEFFIIKHYEKNKEGNPYITERYEKLVISVKRFIEKGTEKGEFQPCFPPDNIALYLISFIDGLMLDTFNLGIERTKVNEQLKILLFTLKQMLCPIIKE